MKRAKPTAQELTLRAEVAYIVNTRCREGLKQIEDGDMETIGEIFRAIRDEGRKALRQTARRQATT